MSVRFRLDARDTATFWEQKRTWDFLSITCSTFFVVAGPGKVVVGVEMCHPNFKACKLC